MSNVRVDLLGSFAPCRVPDACVTLRQPAGDARRDRGGSLDVQEVAEVRHDLEDTRVEQPTVLVGRRHDAAVVVAMELQQGVAMCASALRTRSTNVVSGRTIAR
jgi:hypothetical protein